MSRVIFPPDGYWTKKGTNVNTPAINRPLTDEERSLLNVLTVAAVAKQVGCDLDDAATALDLVAADEGIYREGDAYSVRVLIGRPGDGKRHHTLVNITRELLAFYAHNPSETFDLDRYGTVIPKEQQ
jgi:hypothetical protein